jgi:hypothetical protein
MAEAGAMTRATLQAGEKERIEERNEASGRCEE